MAMEHLYQLGHRRIGIIEGMRTSSTAEGRTQGALAFLKDRGIEVDPSLMAECRWDRRLAYAAARRMLKLREPPTAFFSENDYMALSVRDAVLDLGWSIPENIALVGFDNIDVSGTKGIDLTTISMKRHEIGGLAVELLLRKIREPGRWEPQHIVMEPQLVIRKSCGYGDRVMKGRGSIRVRRKK
jgi:LacI family transcriptional regulator